MFYLCIFKQVQNDLFLYHYYYFFHYFFFIIIIITIIIIIIILLFCRFRLALQINCNTSLFISYNSCKFDRH